MSVIAVRVKEDGFEMSSDSITVRGNTQSRGNDSTFSKLFDINGIVIGSSGLAEEVSLLKLFSKNRTPAESTEQGILEFISEFQDWKKKKTDSGDISSYFFIGYENNVFYVHGWHIEKIKTYQAIGAGMDFALASMYLGHSTEDAVKTAIELSVYCESPVITIKKGT